MRASSAHTTVLYYCALHGLPTTFLTSFLLSHSGHGVRHKKSPRQGTKVPVRLCASYLATSLEKLEEDGYKAAGVLPIAFFSSPPVGCLRRTCKDSSALNSDEEQEEASTVEKTTTTLEQGPQPYALLGAELRPNPSKQIYLNILGGKRENDDDSPADTAWREFWEESGELLLSEEARQFKQRFTDGGDERRVLWFKEAKYALFLYHLPYPAPDWATTITDLFKYRVPKERGEMSSLHWIPLQDILTLAQQTSKKKQDTAVDSDGASYPFYFVAAHMLSNFSLRQHLQSLCKVNRPEEIPPLPASPAKEESIPTSTTESKLQRGDPLLFGHAPSRLYHTVSSSGHRPSGTARSSKHRQPTPFQLSTPITTNRPLSPNAKPFFPRQRHCASGTMTKEERDKAKKSFQ